MVDHPHIDQPPEGANVISGSDNSNLETKGGAKNTRLRSTILAIVGIVASTAVWSFAPDLAKRASELSEELRAKAPGSQYNQQLFGEIQAAEREGARKGAMLLFGIFGGIVGASLAMVNGLLWRSISGAIVGLFTGLIVVGAIGVAVGSSGMYFDDWLGSVLPASGIAYRTVLVHAVAWGAMGLGIGIASGLSLLSLKEAARGMAYVGLAGVCVAFVYVAVSALLFPLQNADRMIPTGSLNQWIWFALASGMMGSAVAATHRDSREKRDSKVVA